MLNNLPVTTFLAQTEMCFASLCCDRPARNMIAMGASCCDAEPENSAIYRYYTTDPELVSDQFSSGRCIICNICGTLLNGPTQWEDHRTAKKHRKRFKVLRAWKRIVNLTYAKDVDARKQMHAAILRHRRLLKHMFGIWKIDVHGPPLVPSSSSEECPS